MKKGALVAAGSEDQVVPFSEVNDAAAVFVV